MSVLTATTTTAHTAEREHLAAATSAALNHHQQTWRVMCQAENTLALLGLRSAALAVREVSPSAVGFATDKDYTGGQRTGAVLTPSGQFAPLRDRLEGDGAAHLSSRSAMTWRALSVDTPPGKFDTVRGREARGGHDHVFNIVAVLEATAHLAAPAEQPAAEVAVTAAEEALTLFDITALVPAQRTSPEDADIPARALAS